MKNWTTWFTSDPHFGHNNVIEYANRPFTDVFHMTESIIENINKIVKEDDLLIWVGDLFFYHNQKEMRETMDRINCKRNILVRGNHDKKPRQMMNVGFEICVEEMTMIIAGEKVLISHYPFRMSNWKYKFHRKLNKIKRFFGLKIRLLEKFHERRPKNKGQFLIHGHTHSKEKIKDRAIHVGVDAWNYKPVNIQEISNTINRIKTKEEKEGKWRYHRLWKKIKNVFFRK